MNWHPLTTADQLNSIDQASVNQTQLILKHSTRCSISDAALSRLERNWQNEDSKKINPYYLDLIQYRDISNLAASHYGIEHQSPQVLIIKNGKCVYSATHFDINYKEIMFQAI
ncbi:MAG: bacillithiol system redox-active protein YtxJ [Bacteroidota bacterium]